MAGHGTVRIKRVYLPPDDGDGKRVLVDRLWPRGLSKADAHLDLWLKEVAPSTELRKWFHEKPQDWAEFRSRYEHELATNPALDTLRELKRQGKLTLLYAAHDEVRNHAVVLADVLG